MSDADRERWDQRYAPSGYLMGEGPKPLLELLSPALPERGRALDVAAGEGQTAVWLARRGLRVDAVDISARGLEKARALGLEAGVEARVRLFEHDLDRGLPDGLEEAYELVTCLHFRPRQLLAALVLRLAPGGLLLAEVLTTAMAELTPEPPRREFLAEPGELSDALVRAGLALCYYREGIVEGRAVAQVLAQRPPRATLSFFQGQALPQEAP
jgi:SAM-dependent methyltransferase